MTPKLVSGRYEVRQPLGAGTLAEVFQAWDRLLARRVAIKFLRPERVADRAFFAAFRRAARAAAALSHPAVVQVYETGFQDGQHFFIVMELVDGGTLRELFRARGPLEPERAAAIAADMAAALEAAHTRGLPHGRLSLHNVLLTREGAVKVADFGIAALAPRERPARLRLETAARAERTGQGMARDLWSLGACLSELLGGVPANSGVPAELRSICQRLLSERGGERFQSAEAVRSALERATAPAESRTLAILPDRGQRQRLAWKVAMVAALTAVGVHAVLPRTPPPARGERVDVPPPTTAGAPLARGDNPSRVTVRTTPAPTVAATAPPTRAPTTSQVATTVVTTTTRPEPTSTTPARVTVPDVRGMRSAGAKAELARHDLRAVAYTVPSSSYDRVVAQSPAPGDEVDAGSEVILWVGSGWGRP